MVGHHLSGVGPSVVGLGEHALRAQRQPGPGTGHPVLRRQRPHGVLTEVDGLALVGAGQLHGERPDGLGSTVTGQDLGHLDLPGIEGVGHRELGSLAVLTADHHRLGHDLGRRRATIIGLGQRALGADLQPGPGIGQPVLHREHPLRVLTEVDRGSLEGARQLHRERARCVVGRGAVQHLADCHRAHVEGVGHLKRRWRLGVLADGDRRRCRSRSASTRHRPAGRPRHRSDHHRPTAPGWRPRPGRSAHR